MLSFAAIVPHELALLPEIGGEALPQAEKTVNALLSLCLAFAKAQPDIVLVISSQAVVLHDRIALGYSLRYTGSLADRGQPKVQFNFPGNKDLVDRIVQASFEAKIATETYAHENGTVRLEAGNLLPLYYFSKAYPGFEMILSSVSDFSLKKHFAYGKALKEALVATEKKVAVIVAGDLSHVVSENSPFGFDPAGAEFDRMVVHYLKNCNIERMLEMDPALLDRAQESCYRGIVTLMGLLYGTDYSPQILSYEAPWGVGYLVANMKL